MAKKKVETPVLPKGRGRPKLATTKPPTPIVMTIRGKPEWEDWLDQLCDRIKREKEVSRVERTDAVDVALRLLAERYDMPAPPDRY